MKKLINDIIAFLEAAKTNGELSVTKVWKGFGSMPENLPIESFPYVTVDEAGERTESPVGSQTQERFYAVLLEYGVYVADVTKALDKVLDLGDQLKVVFEKAANRQLDGMKWGIQIRPFQAEGPRGLYRGRQITIEYRSLEDIYLDY